MLKENLGLEMVEMVEKDQNENMIKPTIVDSDDYELNEDKPQKKETCPVCGELKVLDGFVRGYKTCSRCELDEDEIMYAHCGYDDDDDEVKCSSCGRYFPEDEIFSEGGRNYCDSCADEREDQADRAQQRRIDRAENY